MKILLVEDDEISMFVLKAMISSLGHDAVCCVDGDQAAKSIDKTFDLVITDWMLPIISGLELTAIINSKPWGTPILLMSSMPDDFLKKEAKSVGAHGILPKPYTRELLSCKIKELTEPEHVAN